MGSFLLPFRFFEQVSSFLTMYNNNVAPVNQTNRVLVVRQDNKMDPIPDDPTLSTKDKEIQRAAAMHPNETPAKPPRKKSELMALLPHAVQQAERAGNPQMSPVDPVEPLHSAPPLREHTPIR